MFKTSSFARLLGILFVGVIVFGVLLLFNQKSSAQEDGFVTTQLTQGDVVDRYPAWNPDGTLIAFSRTTDTDNDGQIYVSDMAQIFLMNADGSDQIALTDAVNGTFSAPKWSPDGEYIAYEEFGDRDDNGSRPTHLCIIKSDGTNQKCFLNELVISPRNTVWGPDSSQVAFVHREMNNQSIYILPIDGEEPSLVKQIEWSGFSDISLAWSPDGTQLATMMYGKKNTVDIAVLDMAGELVAQFNGEISDAIMKASLSDYNAVWSPDGKFLAWESKSDRVTNHVVFAGNVETQEIVAIFQDAASPMWSPDGTWLAFVPYPLWGLDAIKMDGSQHVTLLTENFYQASWSPDGTKIVFDQDTSDETQHLYMIDVTGLP